MKYFLLLALVLSCGKNSGSESKKVVNTTEETIEIDIDHALHGQFLGKLNPINEKYTGKIYGAFVFSRDTESTEDEVVIDIRLNNAGPKVVHVQYLKENNRCPTLDDDQNGDGVIDIIEAENVLGKTLIPLDGDISSQDSHDGEFPAGDQYGNYIYSKFTSFLPFMSDLRRSEASYPEYRTLKENEALNIEGRTVLILGIDPTIGLPGTTQTHFPLTAQQSFPIACGTINKVLNPPGI